MCTPDTRPGGCYRDPEVSFKLSPALVTPRPPGLRGAAARRGEDAAPGIWPAGAQAWGQRCTSNFKFPSFPHLGHPPHFRDRVPEVQMADWPTVTQLLGPYLLSTYYVPGPFYVPVTQSCT